MTFKLIPLNWNIDLLDTRGGPVESADSKQAINNHSYLIQLLMVFSGTIVLSSIVFMIGRGPAWDSFMAAFAQIFMGALFPFSIAQQHIASGFVFVGLSSFTMIYVFSHSKLIALDLLGRAVQLIIIFFYKKPDEQNWIMLIAFLWYMLFTLVLLSWVVATAYFFLIS